MDQIAEMARTGRPDIMQQATTLIAQSGVDQVTIMAALAPVLQRHAATLQALLGGGGGQAIASGPAPPGSPVDRMHRKFPQLTFTDKGGGKYVSNTGRLFIVSNNYVYPVERDFTIGRAF
jgi:hypothetical protein